MFQRNTETGEGSFDKWKKVKTQKIKQKYNFCSFEQYDTLSLEKINVKNGLIFLYWSRRVEPRHFRLFPAEIMPQVLGTTQDWVKFENKITWRLKDAILKIIYKA